MLYDDLQRTTGKIPSWCCEAAARAAEAAGIGPAVRPVAGEHWQRTGRIWEIVIMSDTF